MILFITASKKCSSNPPWWSLFGATWRLLPLPTATATMIIHCTNGAPYLSPCPGFDLSLPFLPRSISSSTAWGWPWSTPSRSRWGTSPPPRLYLGQPVITERRGSFSDGPTLFLVVSEQCLQGTRGHLHRLQSIHPCWPFATILKEGRVIASNFSMIGLWRPQNIPKKSSIGLGGVGWTDHHIVMMIFLLLQLHFQFYDLKACHLGHLSACVVTVK